MAVPHPLVEEILKVVRERVSWRGFDKARVAAGIEKFKQGIDVVRLHYLENCVGCGVCAPACPYYTVDEKFSPVNKAELARQVYRKRLTLAGLLLGRLVGAKLPSSERDLDAIVEAIYRCSNCGHCYVACPFGIDSGDLIHGLLSVIAVEAGRVPTIMEFFAELERREAYLEIRPLMDAWSTALLEAEKAVGKRLPLDVKDSDVALVPMITDAMFYPAAVAGAVRVLEAAGVKYTLPSKPLAFRAAIGVVIGRFEAAKEVFERLVARLEELNVKEVVLLDGGFPYPWLRWKLPKILGRRPKFRVLHFVEFVHRLAKEGKLKLEQGDDEVTWHDPCQLVRRGGVTREPYELLRMVSRRFRPLPHHGLDSYCCGGGGGIACLNMEMVKRMAGMLGLRPEDFVSDEKERRFIEETERAWAAAVRRKIEDIRKSRAKIVVTACPVCIESISAGAKLYNLEVDVVHVAEYLSKYVRG